MSATDDETRLVPQSDMGGPSAGFTVGPGALLSHTYRIDKLLARGGMGEIYRATHAKLGTQHAIKIMLPELAKDQKVIDLFTREAAVLRNVRNEAVVGYDGVVCDEEGHLYLIMEFVDGPALSEVLKRGPLAPHEVLLLRDRLAMGLGAAHEKGVIHRDMSPDNVILSGGKRENAKIIDFGIAKLADPEARTVIGGDFAGKYSYASPEQLGMHGGHVDARSDIYSVGLVLAAAAIGRPLDMGKTHMSVLEARRTVPDLADVPAVLRDEIAWMLEPNPDDRPQSMAELLASSGKARQNKAAAGSGKKGGVVALLSGVAALAVVGAGIGGYLILREPPEPGPGATVGAATGAGEAPQPVAEAPPAVDPLSATQTTDAVPPTLAMPMPESVVDPLTPSAMVPDPFASPPHPVAEPVPAAVAGPPPQVANPPNRALIEQEVDEILSRFQCAGLSATLTNDLSIMVDGYLAGNDDRRRLRNALSSVHGVRDVIESISIRPWPFCAAISVLETQAALPPGQSGLPLIRPNNPSLVYQQNDPLVIRATATELFDGYLYIDFIDKEGNVYHLFPTESRTDNRKAAGQEIVVGGGPGGYPGDPNLVINPPFGTDMIVAISTPVPLFRDLRPFTEPASQYLQALSAGLTGLERQGYATPAAGSYVFITSRPRG